LSNNHAIRQLREQKQSIRCHVTKSLASEKIDLSNLPTGGLCKNSVVDCRRSPHDAIFPVPVTGLFTTFSDNNDTIAFRDNNPQGGSVTFNDWCDFEPAVGGLQRFEDKQQPQREANDARDPYLVALPLVDALTRDPQLVGELGSAETEHATDGAYLAHFLGLILYCRRLFGPTGTDLC
jgi:hypothetical protein